MVSFKTSFKVISDPFLLTIFKGLCVRFEISAVGRIMMQTDPRIFPLDPIKNKFALSQWQKKIHSEKVRNGLGVFFKSFIFTQKIINWNHILFLRNKALLLSLKKSPHFESMGCVQKKGSK